MEDAVQDVDPFNSEPPLCQIGPVIPGGWSDAHLESHLVEPMPIVIPPGWSGARREMFPLANTGSISLTPSPGLPSTIPSVK